MWINVNIFWAVKNFALEEKTYQEKVRVINQNEANYTFREEKYRESST